ncbi:hypothetical protein ACFT5B_00865 [Luteimicrobium sp. NPDC057192]|uniref:hypothetical protein n=1 Tax=Luteimicrobium sp. NPDC057192 TaxID=3346042 RepID=UPI00363C710B
MRFGIYPGGALGTADGTLLGDVPDDPAAALTAIDALRAGAPFHVRAYARFHDQRSAGDTTTQAPTDVLAYTASGCRLDLVLQYQSARGDVSGYRRFVRTMIETYAAVLDTVQVGEEINVVDNPTLDGSYPAVLDAVVAGVAAARDAITQLGLDATVGTNTTVLFGDPGFFSRLTTLGGDAFRASLDHVGLDAFPDVFRPLPPGADTGAACSWLLAEHRRLALLPAGLDHLPLRLTEHGCPTGAGRGEARQAELVGAMVTAVLDPTACVESYTHFSLRDATDDDSLFGSFGLTDLRYQPKPAFGLYAETVQAHAAR